MFIAVDVQTWSLRLIEDYIVIKKETIQIQKFLSKLNSEFLSRYLLKLTQRYTNYSKVKSFFYFVL